MPKMAPSRYVLSAASAARGVPGQAAQVVAGGEAGLSPADDQDVHAPRVPCGGLRCGGGDVRGGGRHGVGMPPVTGMVAPTT